METAISLQHISHTFDRGTRRQVKALDDVSLEIRSGEFFVCVGQSGSGKSTLLRIMCGLEPPHRGSVVLGAGLTPRDMAFVFQQFALLPWMTVFENVEIGLLARGVPFRARAEKVIAELKIFGLEKFAHAYPRELSGGMRQRVGIARALATDPKIIFMDEPFSELDSFTAEELRKELLLIWEKRKMTIVMVTHVIPEAVELADRIAVLSASPGTLREIVVNHLPRPRVLRGAEAFSLEDRVYGLIKLS